MFPLPPVILQAHLNVMKHFLQLLRIRRLQEIFINIQTNGLLRILEFIMPGNDISLQDGSCFRRCFIKVRPSIIGILRSKESHQPDAPRPIRVLPPRLLLPRRLPSKGMPIHRRTDPLADDRLIIAISTFQRASKRSFSMRSRVMRTTSASAVIDYGMHDRHNRPSSRPLSILTPKRSPKESSASPAHSRCHNRNFPQELPG